MTSIPVTAAKIVFGGGRFPYVFLNVHSEPAARFVSRAAGSAPLVPLRGPAGPHSVSGEPLAGARSLSRAR